MRAAALRLDALLTRRVLLTGAVVIVVLDVVGLVVNVVLGHPPRTFIGTALLPDYVAHWTGGRLLLDGRTDTLYDVAVQHTVQTPVTGSATELSWFVGPPVAAVLFAPFALLPYPASAAAWTVVSLALLGGSAVLARPLLPRLGSARTWPAVVLVVAATQPVLEVVGIGQDSALSLFLWVCGLRLLASGRDAAAGAVLALGLVKPQLFALVPLLLLVQRRWRGLAAWCATASGLALVSVAVVGPQAVADWASVLVSQEYHDRIQSFQAWMMQGVPSFLTAVVPPALGPAAGAVGYAVAAALVVATLVVAWRAPRGAVVPVWALGLLTTVVANPHLLGYDLVVALPALLVVLDRHDRPLVRLSLLLMAALTWSSLPRHRWAGGLEWPGVVLAASWCTLPLLALWAVMWRDCRLLPPDPSPDGPASGAVPASAATGAGSGRPGADGRMPG